MVASNKRSMDSGGLLRPLAVLVTVAVCVLPQAGRVSAECPLPNDLPVWHDGSGRYMAAKFYQERGGDQPINGCVGDHQFDLWDGAEWNIANEGNTCDGHTCCDGIWGYDTGSFVVRPGCSVYAFQYCDFQGSVNQHDGPTIIALTSYVRAASLKARCNLAYVDCQPSDRYEVLLQCDATQAAESINCNYMKTIGTTYETSISNTISVDTTVASHVEATFFELFSAGLDVSVTTGYNWNEVSTETTQSVETFEVQASAPPGTVLVIQQAVGHCGGSQVNTELFKVSHQYKDGTILDVRYELVYRNGTVVPYLM